MSKFTTYRPDIDGLRALSIIPVVLFHAQIPGFEGGFVGVDTFFVISGWLITSLIVSGIENKTFRFNDFYTRRARRLIPALLLVYSAAIGFTIIHGTSTEIDSTIKQIFASLFYLSNWYYLFEIDYFSPSSLDYILLHTWSLSIEEQFYLIFPILIFALMRVSRNAAVIFIIGITIISFVYSSFLSYSGQTNGSYYNSLSRFWEIGLGASAALTGLRLRRHASIIRVAALLVVLAAPLLITRDMPFPAPAALPSVLAALFLIVAVPTPSDWTSRVLETKPLVYLGRLSYSIYLWHWVIFAIAYKLGQFLLNSAPILIAVTLLLSVLTYHLVERPLRGAPYDRSQKLGAVALGGFASSLLLAAPFVLQAQRGEIERLDPQSAYARIMAYGESGFRESGELAIAYRGGECFLEPGGASNTCSRVLRGEPEYSEPGAHR